MFELFDTHAHLNDEQFANPAAVVERARVAGVTRMVAVATTAANTADCLRLARTLPGVFASAGIHPNYTHEAQPGDWDAVVRLASEREVVALGETGLDRYWKDAPFDLQQDYFDRHIRLSQQIQKPFIVHMRDCAADVMKMLRAARVRGPLKGVMHSFTGDEPMAAECVGLGLYISFAGMLTYKKSDDLRAVASTVSLERLLVETDSPYLSPEPHRGQRPNEPARVMHTAECLAKLHKLPLEELARTTTANACRLFGLARG